MSVEQKTDFYQFPMCMHALNAAFHRLNIDPSKTVITLPRDQWWKLACALERKFQHVITYDGRTASGDLGKFCYMGFTFKPDDIK